MHVPAREVDGLVVEFQGREGGKVFIWNGEIVSRAKVPVVKAAGDKLGGIPGEIWGVRMGETGGGVERYG